MSVLLDTPIGSGAVPLVVGEMLFCGFEVGEREPDTEYQVQIGDLDPEGPPDGTLDKSSTAIGRARGRRVEWDDALHFESARGKVVVRLSSRAVGNDGSWHHRAQLVLNVLPSKLSEERYQAMFDQLNGLALGLVFDLISKSVGALHFARARQEVSVRSNQVELRVLDRIWGNLSNALRAIELDPWLALRRGLELRPTWGGERMSCLSLSELAARGVDPRHPSTPRPFAARRERLFESSDTQEHRCVAGFLRVLLARVRDCRASLDNHIEAIERDREFRDCHVVLGPTLYEAYDLPRVRRLREAVGLAATLEDRLREASRLPFLRNVRPLLRLPSSPIFRHVQSYRQVRQAIIEYLGYAPFVFDQGLEDRIKSTSRMYEQWVFLQLASAFRSSGLRCHSEEGLIQYAGSRRFTLDIERGTAIAFGSPDGRSIILRYEPWILPAGIARQRRHVTYRGTAGDLLGVPIF